MQFKKKYYVLVGHYGSGKTELAIALARHLNKKSHSAVALVDLDIVNPYFRSSAQQELIKNEGIDIIMPPFANSTVDVPALSAAVHTVFDQDRYTHVIFDVGGDATGATALGRYYPQLQAVKEQLQVLYVVNPCRPLSADEDAIYSLMQHIEAKARIQVDVLVNNANLQRQTTAQHLIDAQALLLRVAQRCQCTIGMVCGYEHLREKLPEEMQHMFFPVQPIMLPEWLEDDES